MLRILLVEDEALISLVTSIALEDAGYHVTVAIDGREGLQIAQQYQPELIITDYMMPRMTGLELIRQLRESGFIRPIILATSILEENLPDRPEYNAYIQKPYREAELLSAIRRVAAAAE
ncbi:response regulator [Phenylobacterium sp.]|uniref:response regulator n=1 Tax=Phenylobacterium sp. TaxID=1871053 RepID=UPI001999FB0D|nr:response regulator [Phenylobacterium sp.]MBC7167930.1 response regulator [Phenylobacterium sp.]